MRLVVQGISSKHADAIRAGGPDANGQPAIVRVAEGMANPCRHCLQLIEEGEDKLVLSYRPFGHAQPYAESGPIFLHNRGCPRYESDSLPSWFAYLQPAIVRGTAMTTGSATKPATWCRAASSPTSAGRSWRKRKSPMCTSVRSSTAFSVR